MAVFTDFSAVFSPLIEIKENNMEQQQILYKNEVVKGIDYKPTKKQGSFQWRVFAESGNMYSFFAPTFEQDQTTLQGIFATNTVKIGYTTHFFNGKTYCDLMSIDREMSSNDTSPAMDAAITQQEQQSVQANQQVQYNPQQALDQAGNPVPPPVQSPVVSSKVEHTTEPQILPEPDFIGEPELIGDPKTIERMTMMADPIARATIAAAIINAYQANGLLGKGADTIMKKVYGIIEAMDSLGE